LLSVLLSFGSLLSVLLSVVLMPYFASFSLLSVLLSVLSARARIRTCLNGALCCGF
jgi:hypothetical protein